MIIYTFFCNTFCSLLTLPHPPVWMHYSVRKPDLLFTSNVFQSTISSSECNTEELHISLNLCQLVKAFQKPFCYQTLRATVCISRPSDLKDKKKDMGFWLTTNSPWTTSYTHIFEPFFRVQPFFRVAFCNPKRNNSLQAGQTPPESLSCSHEK